MQTMMKLNVREPARAKSDLMLLSAPQPLQLRSPGPCSPNPPNCFRTALSAIGSTSGHRMALHRITQNRLRAGRLRCAQMCGCLTGRLQMPAASFSSKNNASLEGILLRSAAPHSFIALATHGLGANVHTNTFADALPGSTG